MTEILMKIMNFGYHNIGVLKQVNTQLSVTHCSSRFTSSTFDKHKSCEIVTCTSRF